MVLTRARSFELLVLSYPWTSFFTPFALPFAVALHCARPTFFPPTLFLGFLFHGFLPLVEVAFHDVLSSTGTYCTGSVFPTLRLCFFLGFRGTGSSFRCSLVR